MGFYPVAFTAAVQCAWCQFHRNFHPLPPQMGIVLLGNEPDVFNSIKCFTHNSIVINYAEATNLITLARGELLYADNLTDKIIQANLAEKNFFECINKTFSNFEKDIENNKNSYFTLARIALSFCAVIISFLLFFASEIYIFSHVGLSFFFLDSFWNTFY